MRGLNTEVLSSGKAMRKYGAPKDERDYRVTLLASGNGFSEGYGSTIEQAMDRAKGFYLETFGKSKPKTTVIERVSDDGMHYVEVG